MTTVNELFPSKYLTAADAETELNLTVSRIAKEKMRNRDGEEESKSVIYFKEVPKGMVLNKTNVGTLTEMYGEVIEDWYGQRVILGTEDVESFGKRGPALRFRHTVPALSRADLLKRYEKLFEEARATKVDDLETYSIPADADEAHIIEMGKALREAVAAAKVF